MSDILVKLNECRAKGGFLLFTYPRLARMLKGYNTVQLAALIEDCACPTIPFSALFFSKLKPKKFVQQPRLPEPSL